ncbi:MAG: DnaJ C-terminal domain-containing protein [Actinomycetaceae bacterium]|nr:DnaJ C-terminal domain-containing protein [Actinomycetaceae bacterium]
MTSNDWLDKDYYKVLGVPQDISEKDLKKAYRKLARTWHPDQNPGDTKAEERFKEIGEAYSVLSDSQQRKQYDALRAMASGGARFRAGGGRKGSASDFEDVFSSMFGGAGGTGGPGASYTFSSSGASSGDFADILNMFGGAGGTSGPGAGGFPTGQPAGAGTGFPGAGSTQDQGRRGFGLRTPSRGHDLSATTTLTFKQAYNGATVRLKVEGDTMTVRIPPAVRDGQKIRLRGKGRPGAYGGNAGDLVVSVKVNDHPYLRVEGKDLAFTLPVTFAEASLGANVDVPLPDGRSVKVKIPAGTPSGSVLRVPGYGPVVKDGTGDLLLTIQVAVPDKLSREAKKAIEDFVTATQGANPRDGLDEQVRL